MFRTLITTAMLTLTITAAQAGSSATVSFGDLDLSRPADVQVLNSRIAKAAEAICGLPNERTTSMFYNQMQARCVSRITTDTSTRIAAVSGKYRAFASK